MIETIAWVVGSILFLSWLAIVFVGAPYVPTKKRDLQRILKAAGLKKGDLIVDLGSGDGRLLVKAAQSGYKAVGYELNPFLVLLTWWRLKPYRKLADVRMVDFWRTPLPEGTKAVFVFLAAPFMLRLERQLIATVERTGQSITLVSYAFKIPGLEPDNIDGPLMIYHFKA